MGLEDFGSFFTPDLFGVDFFAEFPVDQFDDPVSLECDIPVVGDHDDGRVQLMLDF